MTAALLPLSVLFDQLLALPEAERDAWLERLALTQPSRAQELREMLLADAEAGPGTGSAEIPLFGQALAGTLFEGRSAAFDALGFKPLKLLGRGGMGEVWLVERQIAGRSRQLALKLLQPPPERMAAAQWLQRFHSEQRILIGLDHPGIARLIDAGETAGQPWIAIEYVDGTDIVRWCDQQRLDLTARLKLFQQVCAAVQYAHDRLIVHRDLKPANVLVNSAGQAKLLDFGIAKMLGDEDATQFKTGTAQQLFSLYGVAPEQLLGQRPTVGTDVYALGALLYEMVCGQSALALDGMSGFAAIEQHVLHEAPRAPSVSAAGSTAAQAAARAGHSPESLARAIRGDLDRIVLHALRKRPDERYLSARELSADISRLLDHEVVYATGFSRSYRARKFLRRHRVGVSIALAILTVLLGSLWQMKRERDAAEIARESAERVSDFMVQIFESGDPLLSNDGEVTAAELVRNGLKQMREQNLAAKVQGRLLIAFARALNGIGDIRGQNAVLQQLVEADASLDPMDRVSRDLMRVRIAFAREGGPTGHKLFNSLLRGLDPAELSAEQRESFDLIRASDLRYGKQYRDCIAIIESRLWGRRTWPEATLMKAQSLIDLGEPEEAARYLETRIAEGAQIGIADVRLASLSLVRATALGTSVPREQVLRIIDGAREILRTKLSERHHAFHTNMLRVARAYHALGDVDRAVDELWTFRQRVQGQPWIRELSRYFVSFNLVVMASESVRASPLSLERAWQASTEELEMPTARGNPAARDALLLARLRLLVLRGQQTQAKETVRTYLDAAAPMLNGRERQVEAEGWAWLLAPSVAANECRSEGARVLAAQVIDDLLLKQVLADIAQGRCDCQRPLACSLELERQRSAKADAINQSKTG